ncbi:restriction endonuclease subunit S [Rothia dentocariosa]|uniref:restriction endonuclease subunit S n=1 Tax=Rothia dentocariosa TaxID=2047 RepID=UPI0028D64B27|nr:restriction endonuclease subunit S [Rothia dentocariosa]
MSDVRMVKLGDLCEHVHKIDPHNTPDMHFKYIDIGSVDNHHKKLKDVSTFTGITAPSRARQVVLPGDIVVSTVRPNLNAIAILPHLEKKYIASTGFSVLRISEQITAKYVFYYLQSKRFIHSMINLATGASYPAVTDKTIKSHLVPIPSLEEQKRIVAILDKAKSIQEARERQLAALDELITTIFKNLLSGKYPSSPLGKLATFYGGSSLPEGSVVPSKSFSMLMKVSDMNRSGNEKYIAATGLYSTQTTTGNSTCPKGSIVLPKRGASILTNKKRITTQNTMLDPNLMGITPNSSVNLEYLYNWFQCFDLATIVSGSSVPQINKRDLSPLKVPVPPLYLQEELAHKIKIIEAQAILTRKSLELDKTLFSSLQSSLLRSKC